MFDDVSGGVFFILKTYAFIIHDKLKMLFIKTETDLHKYKPTAGQQTQNMCRVQGNTADV